MCTLKDGKCFLDGGDDYCPKGSDWATAVALGECGQGCKHEVPEPERLLELDEEWEPADWPAPF